MDKMNINRFNLLKLLSALMALITVFGVVGSLSVLPVFAAEEEEEVEERPIIDYYTQVFNSPEEKLETMDYKTEAYGYELYYEPVSGEVALRNQVTGEVLFTNPYDIASMGMGSDETRNQLLSQIIVRYTDNDQEKSYYSYTEASQRGQIKVKNVKNGIRVEYTIGKEETRNLVPYRIEASRFKEQILAYIEDEQALKKLNAFYTLKDPDDPKLTVRGVRELQATFPITQKMAVYVFDPYASAREITLIEGYIKLYCPHYTYAELDADHQMTEYTGLATAPALFKMALEYYLNEDGMEVRLPANGIRFDETTYQLNYIQILPYIGAGSYDNEGYTFIPDGSGTIIRFEDFKGSQVTISGKIYGQDYSYQELSGAHQEVMRMPVYGVVQRYYNKYDYEVEVEVEEEVTTEVDGETVTTVEMVTKTETRTAEIDEDRGYLAIITEGDSLANIMTTHGGALHKYCTVYTQFNPRPKDSYNLAESMSVGANATWTVVSKRKYTGSYRIQFVMLTDENLAKENNIKDYYETEWTGMARAYRDYLLKNELLSPVEDTKTDIPLYVETLGAIRTQDTFLSIPVTVKTPITSFEDIQTMYDRLSADQISNIVFKLTGYYNGGMDHYMAVSQLKFEKKLGGKSGWQDLLAYADSKDIVIYPSFNFAYRMIWDNFDGVSTRKDMVKTIDGRYSIKREYDFVSQSYSYRSYGISLNLISPSVFMKLYDKFKVQYDKVGASGLAVGSLGSDLNSDFDKKDPYNREDSKEHTIKLLAAMYEDYGKILIDAGNAYAIKYATHILNVPLDSSRYYYSSQAVPFMGMVLHGYVSFAGSPTNMAGDIRFENLKIIENGASPYYILAYQNTAKMKEDFEYAQYYSISFEIWYNDLVENYNLLNDNLKDLQTETIENHEFINYAERIPTEKEIEADRLEAEELALAELEADELKAAKDELKALREARQKAAAGEVDEETPVEDTTAEETEVIEAPVSETETDYVANKYTCALGTVVKVTYSNGVYFILNYNSFAITVDGKTIDALSFIRVG